MVTSIIIIIFQPGFVSPLDFGNIVTKRNYILIEKEKDFTGINEKRPIQNSDGRDVLMFSPFPPKDGHLHSELIEEKKEDKEEKEEKEKERIPEYEIPMFGFSGTRTKFLKINIWVINCISTSFAILIST
ncbi:UNVERIFIED_CONTAM: hypothetical protein RMT77_005996 [Armadillidium vulgare]